MNRFIFILLFFISLYAQKIDSNSIIIIKNNKNISTNIIKNDSIIIETSIFKNMISCETENSIMNNIISNYNNQINVLESQVSNFLQSKQHYSNKISLYDKKISLLQEDIKLTETMLAKYMRRKKWEKPTKILIFIGGITTAVISIKMASYLD